MKTIYKYKLELKTNPTLIPMPKYAEILSVKLVDEGYDVIYIWALVDNQDPVENVTMEIFGTGHEIPKGNRKFIGTVFSSGGMFVLHVFQKL